MKTLARLKEGELLLLLHCEHPFAEIKRVDHVRILSQQKRYIKLYWFSYTKQSFVAAVESFLLDKGELCYEREQAGHRSGPEGDHRKKKRQLRRSVEGRYHPPTPAGTFPGWGTLTRVFL